MQTLQIEKGRDYLTEEIISSLPIMAEKLPAANDEHQLNILLVDDDDVAVESVIRSMHKFGVNFPITVAEDGQTALDILRGKHPQVRIDTPYLVLLDLKMPRMDGFEFLKALRADPELSSTVVFVLTTSDANTDRAKAYNENIAGYLLKDSLTMFNWLYSLLPKYTKFSNLLDHSKSVDLHSGAH